MTEPHTYQTSRAALLYPAANMLGEGPVWHAARQSIFWVDIEGKRVQELTWPAKQEHNWPMPQRVGMVVPSDKSNLVVALEDGLYRLNLDSSTLQELVAVEKDVTENRPNDGKCDREGRLWLGTMHRNAKESRGALYCIDKSNITQQLTGLSIANGMAWSLDDQYFYFIDSVLHRIDRYLFDACSGTITFNRTVVKTPEELGLPDGMAIDDEGMLWVAHWDGFCVCRWHPDTGALLHKIEMPVPQVSSCTFGGKNLDQLIITTARVDMSEEALRQYPQSGHLFVAQPGVKGQLPNHFKRLNDIPVK
jgi:sugar lactone lactonase YvrE